MEYLAKLNALIDDYVNFHLVGRNAKTAYPKEYIGKAIIFYCAYSDPNGVDTAFEIIRNEVKQINTYDSKGLESMLSEILPAIEKDLTNHLKYVEKSSERNGKVFWNMVEKTAVLIPAEIKTLLDYSVAKYYKQRCETVIELINEVILNDDASLKQLDNIIEKQFTAIQWAIIFYYAFAYKQLTKILKKDAILEFTGNNKVTTTKFRISNEYCIVKKGIENDTIKISDLEDVKNYIRKQFDSSTYEAIDYDIATIRDAQDRK